VEVGHPIKEEHVEPLPRHIKTTKVAKKGFYLPPMHLEKRKSQKNNH